MDNSRYSILIYCDKNTYCPKIKNLNSTYVRNLQECLHKLSLFSYDVILIKEDGIETDICQIITIIRTLTYVPILAIANVELKQIKKIVYAGCDIIVTENYSDDTISTQLWTLARRYRKWNKEKGRQNSIIKKGKLVMEREQQKINWNGIELHLSRQE